MTNDDPAPVSGPGEIVFGYGTLRSSQVQQHAVLGRNLLGRDDRLVGHRLSWVSVTDPGVLAISGNARHPVLHCGEPGDTVPGVALRVTSEELGLLDGYEVDYVRERRTLESGTQAWVYVARPTTS